MLRADDAVGRSFDFCCPRHPETELEASRPEFERLSPEGGYQLVCSRRLNDCGHQCLARCHSESMHRVLSCSKRCEGRLHSPCSHPCQKSTCGEECGKCMKVDGVQLLCGHLKNGVNCHFSQDVAKITRDTVVEKLVPGCNHAIEVRCSEDVTSPFFRCQNPCDAMLQCGHPCRGTCGICSEKDGAGDVIVRQSICKKTCDRRFGTCNHTCPLPCHDGSDCGSCQLPCEVSPFFGLPCFSISI